MKQYSNFTAYWLGKCPVKGCACLMHIDIPMVREDWKQTLHNHAHGYSYEVPKSRSYPDKPYGQYFSPRHFYLHCVTHKRELSFVPVNGRYSEGHVCDDRCMNARGPNCECSCGGANHGRGHHVEIAWKPAPMAKAA